VPPTEEDLARLRKAFDAFNVMEVDLEDYFNEYYAPDGVIEFVDGFPVRGRYEGIDGFRRFYEDSYAPYEDVVRRLDSLTIEGECVVSLMTLMGRPKGEDVDLEVHVGNTYELENGRIKYLRVYVGHERALEAARES
jgi:hypothetical protein